MQVILVKPVRKLGKVGDTVKVKDGYGRNYLIPQQVAIRATKENIGKFDSIKKDIESKNNENKTNAEKVAKLIAGKSFNFIAQSAADGRLFGSVSAKMLAEKISMLADNYQLNYSNILLDSPIRSNGVYSVSVVLHADVIESVLVVVAKSESEANDALRDYKEGGKKEVEQVESEEITPTGV
jgi:large subunit ribosomal protein L9